MRIEIAGLSEIPPLDFYIKQQGNDKAFGGDTLDVRDSIDLCRLGASDATGNVKTFSFQKPLYVCEVPHWTCQHIKRLLEAALAREVPHYAANVRIK